MLDIYSQQLLVFVLILTRVGGLVMSAPIFGPRGAPLQVRVVLAVAISALVTPLQATGSLAMPGTLVQLLVLLAREAALGLALGLALTIFFAGLQVAGQLIGQMSGLQLADVFDPTFDSTMPIFGQLLDLIAMGAFVAMNGHRKVMAALLDTFRWRPPGVDDFPVSIVDTLTAILTESFIVGIRAGAPVMVALLLAVLLLGLVSRTLPQLNIFAIGFSLNSLVVLATLAFSLATIGNVVDQRSEAMLVAVRDALSAAP